MAGGFQTQVNVQPAPAVAGDFCDANPRASVDAGPGGLVAGALGAIVGRFAWAVPPTDGDGFPAIVNNFGSGPVTGFLGRQQQGLITTYLANASMTIPQGYALGLFKSGGYWVKNDGTVASVVGQKAFANYADGKVSFAAAGGSPASASVVGSIAAQTTTFNGSISGELLTVTNLVSGTIGIGTILTGGTGVQTGTQIIQQVSGTVGGVGVYRVTPPGQTVNSALLTGTYGLLTVSSVNAGALGLGDVLVSGTAIVPSGTAGSTVITALGTGLGGTGTYLVSPSQNSTPALTITASLAVETKWYCMSVGLVGELVKISSNPNG